MVAPGFLANPEVRRWLNGVGPAWTMLDFDSFNALHDEPSATNHAIRFEANLASTKISGSAITANTLVMLALEQHGPLQAVLFHVAFWHMNLAYFDRYPVDSWPLTQVGVILWSLSASAHDWLPGETLTRLCATPVIGVLESRWDFGSSAMEAPILRPLVWFGLLETRSEGTSPTELIERRLYRKAPLFDSFVKFNVRIEGPDTRH